ncbi:hypothetical protein PIB30_003701 [Stylosanthes scabra]|uniref:Uncharacterized protein n=1 Tax=Stylosanthes scabra TaxID=79078 RepID=A0ABU6Q3A5_9FABA|nr:hypothetical protein [Stylosanthes scabra]
MGWETKLTNQMLSCCSLLLLIKSTTTAAPSWIAILNVFLLLFSSYVLLLLAFGYFSILYTSLVLLFSSTVFYTLLLSRHKAVVVVEEKKLLCTPPPAQQETIALLLPAPLTVEAKEAQEQDANRMDVVHAAAKPDLISSECDDEMSTCEDSEEVDWSVRFGECCSDGSISDEDSLIEIALPSGHYLGQQKRRRELSSAAEALFSHHQSLMELLSELNNDMSEEENLIEIDISMGSIKYSRFEIKA